MNVLEERTSPRYGYRRSASAHETAASYVYSKTESVPIETMQKPAQAAAALAFLRGRERSSLGLDPRVTRSASNGQGGQRMSQQNNNIRGTMNILKRRQSVRFVNRNAETQRTRSSASTQIFTEPRPGFATVKPKTTTQNTPASYRPVSPLSSFGKGSTASEVPDFSMPGPTVPIKYSIRGNDILSSDSVHCGIRKSRSMFIPLKAPDIHYTNRTPEQPSSSCYHYRSGISNIPMHRMESRQIQLKAHKSMSFLGLMRNNSSSPGRMTNDLQVQIARDRFLHQMNQQRLRNRPSFLFRVKTRRQALSGHISSESSDGEGISSWKESRLRGKARRTANKIRNGLRRVFGRSLKAPVDIPQQQVDAPISHVKEYSATEIQGSLSDTDSQSSRSISDTRESLGSYKKMTIRLVPPTPRHLPIYQLSQDHKPQDVSYSESVYSRSTGSLTPELASSHDNLPNTGSALIHDTVTYGLSSTTSYTNDYSNKTGAVVCRHIRENAQINNDDREVAQAAVPMIKQPLGELQHNAMLNPDFIPVLKPTKKTGSTAPLMENIGFNRPMPPPLPPPIGPSAVHTQVTSRSTVTPTTLPRSQQHNSAAKVSGPGLLADMIMLSRDEGTSPKPSDQLPYDSAPTFLQEVPHPSSEVRSDNKGTKSDDRSYERLWNLEIVPKTWRTNESLRTMLVERGNIKRPISATVSLNIPDTDTGTRTGKPETTAEIDTLNNGGENADPHAEGENGDIYGIEGAGLMGPSIACRNNQLVGSLLNSRRSKITGCSESDSEEAFI